MSDDVYTLIGIVLDVSGSMQENVDDRFQKTKQAWVRSIFQVIDDLIKHDVSSSNCVFAIGVGARHGVEVFDVISTLKPLQPAVSEFPDMSHDQIIENILRILENGGAGTVRKWAPKSSIKEAVEIDTAKLLLSKLKYDRSFVRSFVYECLPSACRDFEHSLVLNLGYHAFASVASNYRTASKEEIEEVIEKAKILMNEPIKVSIESSIFSVQEAHSIIHGCVDEEELTDTRIQELVENVEPFIYGGTPLYESLKRATELFSVCKYRGHKKLLFILSDGEPTDDGNPKYSFRRFKDDNIFVVNCFISKSTNVEPCRLYNVPVDNQGWDRGAKTMFELSSTIPTQSLPRTIFIEREWKIDIETNETKLFLQVNHPDIIRDVCDFARNVVCSQDALSDILASVSLDIYINQRNSACAAPSQIGETCYANASAAVLHLSMKRILGREGGYPDFHALRKKMIKYFGYHGADTLGCLQKFCHQYRLRCQKVDMAGARRAITKKRPVVATFSLTKGDWDVFERFYEKSPSGILTEENINIFDPQPGDISGHAVVLTSYNSECLRLMNSWGHEWGDMGFFRVKNAGVIGLKFFDVFWELEDLKESEKTYYEKHGSEVAAKLMKCLTSLQLATYKCPLPLCNQTSLVTEFTGQLLRAKCPKCKGEFRSDEAGNILAMNMYLTSLIR